MFYSKSITIIKRSAAIVHKKDKLMPSKIASAIIKASSEVINGKMNENFPLKVGKLVQEHKQI